jgi:signal transduction histidine kinase
MWLSPLNRLQRKVVNTILVMVVVPMLVAGILAAEWVSTNFENRLQRWIEDSARVGEIWLRAYQNDSVMLGGVLADDPDFIDALDRGDMAALRQPVARIAKELNINFLQVYTTQQMLVYSSMPIQLQALWEIGQAQAVMKVVEKKTNLLAAVGITPVPRVGKPRYYLVLGGLLNKDFMSELNQLTGLRTRLYYREGARYYDIFTQPGKVMELKELPKDAMAQLQKQKKPYYSTEAEDGRYRGQYTPVVDSKGRVEAILFSGLERRGFEELITNRVLLFISIMLLGVLISVLVGVFLSRLVVRPVEHLRNGVMQLSAQNFNASVPIMGDDEVGDLARAFNAMAVRLRQARDEQQQRFRKDKLASLGELSASLAHEIRNPIGVINTSAALLEKADDPEKRAELVRMIREESARVGSLVQDFLQLSRNRQPSFATIDPAAPMERALASALAGRENIQVEKSLRHDQRRINADAGLLQQAWGNILNNALQAMGDEGGTLRIESRIVDDHLVELAVEDSGPGIAPDIMPRLFEPFFTTKEQGTGLGLSIANTLIEANAGRLEVQNPQQGGARFAMTFPVQEEAA